MNIIYLQNIKEQILIMSQSKRAFTSFQEVLIIKADKIKISVSNLFYDEKEKLNFFFVQVKLYIKKYRNEF